MNVLYLLNRILPVAFLMIAATVTAKSVPKEVKTQIKTLQKEGWMPIDTERDGTLADQVAHNYILENEEAIAPVGTPTNKYIKGVGKSKSCESLMAALTMANMEAHRQISSVLKTKIQHFVETESTSQQLSATESSSQTKMIHSTTSQSDLEFQSDKMLYGLKLYREVKGQTEVMLTVFYALDNISIIHTEK